MQWKGLKINVIVFSLLAGIALIFSAQYFYQKYSTQGPLNTALNNSQTVESYQLKNENNQLLVSVKIRYDANLMQAYKEVRKELVRVIGRKAYTLSLSDSRDDVLEQVWYQSQYAVYQAQTQGSFQEMASVVNREAQARGAEAKIYVDQENIYLRLLHQGHTLDEVIPRGEGQVAGNLRTSGSGGGTNAQGN
ncbi:hypothetical protein [Pelotomaculum propionicicum]|uniref:Uncharacterized protein n=1 Tax=Pelotomaculum propionicicum TaxID=258475 RepID=A0A4Y7RLZ9_9FIRM|nr:hypothetical protein [Pelotomaculum propionicicum]NLI12663.1 hypothetical protein [Peptococcaceae bacterium]TEB09759.1 hypothetical protein Pmgp_02855 [Pelotomaculum propionicicum]